MSEPVVVKRISDKIAIQSAESYSKKGYAVRWLQKNRVSGWEPALKDGAEIQCGTLTLMAKKPKVESEQEKPSEPVKQKPAKQKQPKDSE